MKTNAGLGALLSAAFATACSFSAVPENLGTDGGKGVASSGTASGESGSTGASGGSGGGSGSSSGGACIGPPPISCNAPLGCAFSIVCGDGGWTCQVDCGGESSGTSGTSGTTGGSGCGGRAPPCYCPDNCTGGATCSSGSWVCACLCGADGGTCEPNPCPRCPARCADGSSCTDGVWSCSCACDGSGSTSSSGGSGGCFRGAPNEIQPCTSDADCACPLLCVPDALVGGNVCEHPCSVTSDCPTPYTSCTGTTCTVDLCGVAIGGPPNGTLYGPCTADAVGSGTCIPASSDGGIPWGVCEESGTATGGCDPNATRREPSRLCAEGSLCAPAAMGGGAVCWRICQPATDGGSSDCDGGERCLVPDPTNPALGLCYP